MVKCVCIIYNESTSSSTSQIATIMGVLTLSQASEDSPTIIEGKLKGLTPGKHGIHVCTYGNLSEGAASCGPIFNPFGKTHGHPDDMDQRMVGDLGNLVVGGTQETDPAEIIGTLPDVCDVKLSDRLVKLLGPHSIIGRSLVIYAGEDDCGRGGHENSLTTGNPGPRIGAGVVGLAAS
jgi:superoxide dismutase, Cu-Zn family